MPKLVNITANQMNPQPILINDPQNTNPAYASTTSSAGNISTLAANIPPAQAAAWWNDFQKQALNNPDGPYRDLSNGEDQRRLFVINSGDFNKSDLQPVSFDPPPDPRTLYAYAQNGRLLLSPMGRTDLSYQIQVDPESPERSEIVPFNYSDLLKEFPDPRQGIGYAFMRVLNVLTFGRAYANDLKALDDAAETLESMRNAMTKTFLTEDGALRERNDPRCMSNALGSTAPENYAVRFVPEVEESPYEIPDAVIQHRQKRDYITNLENFNDYVYSIFEGDEYPTPLMNSRLTMGPPQKTSLMVDLDNNSLFTAEQSYLMAFLAVADPSLNYYQGQHPVGYTSPEEQAAMLSGEALAHQRFFQLIDGAIGKPGSLDAVYDPCKQASIKISLLFNQSANSADFAQPIRNGLELVQGILQNSTVVDDRFLFAAALSNDILTLLEDNPPLKEALESQGFKMDRTLLEGAANFYQMQTNAVKGEFEIMQKGDSPYGDRFNTEKNQKVSEDDLEHLAWVTQSRYQMQNIKINGLQNVVRNYAHHRFSDAIHEKIQQSPQFKKYDGATYGQLAKDVSGGTALTKLCVNALSGAGNTSVNRGTSEISIGSLTNTATHTMPSSTGSSPSIAPPHGGG